MKSIVRKMVLAGRPLLRVLLSFFYEKKYLSGRHFDAGLGGYAWAFRSVWTKNILRLGRPMPWPTGLTCLISNPKNIEFHVDDLNNFQTNGTYFQNFSGRIVLGKGVYIAPNVGLITANHRLDDLDSYDPGQDIVVGEKCWIGMGAIILPGVCLGPGTIVAAGAVVTSSFTQGNVVIAGVPAKIVKRLG